MQPVRDTATDLAVPCDVAGLPHTGIIHGWPAQPSLMPAYEWFMAALDASL
jgi:hypothetical protein